MKNFKKLSMYDENIETTASNSTDPLLGLDNVSESDFQEMFECLRDLMDLQNGCPLPTYKEAYDETIDRCEKILSKYEE